MDPSKGEPNQKKAPKAMAKKETEEFQFVVYNTMTQQKEVFKPKIPGKVGMYVCGVTAYDFSHLGHARAAVAFDVLYRYLQHLGYEVTYVRNFTDVDDKIIRRANETGEDPLCLSDRYCKEYNVDMADLQCLSPTHEPRVSDHIEQIKDMITQIINKDFGYVVDGDVFFAVDKFPNYGKLSGQRLENNRAGERVAVDSRKRNPSDFALWKTLKDCQDALSKLQEEIPKDGKPAWTTPDAQECISKLCSEFQAKMSDDLSTSLILTGAFLEALKLVNNLLTMLKKKQQQKQRLLVIQSLIEVEKEVKKVLNVLGLQPPYSYTEVLLKLKEKALTRAGLVEDDVVHLINERAEVRRNKDFLRSDQMRADLQAKGIALMDVGTETIWRPCVPVQQEPEVVPSGGQKVPAETGQEKKASLDSI